MKIWLERRVLRPLRIAVVLVILAGPHVWAQDIVAHRGASEDAPENTLAAFELAWQQGADAIEGDFYLTTDRRIVTIHDRDTKRTAGVTLRVAESSLEQLRALDVGAWKSTAYRGQRIPTLEEVLAVVRPGKKILIEIKCGPEIVPVLKKVLARCTLPVSQTTVIAFDESVIRATKQQIPNVKAYWLTGYKQDKETGAWSPTLAEVLSTLRRSGADGLDSEANTEVVNTSFARALREAGYELHVWTIDDPQKARRFQELGVGSITTNRPRKLRASLSRGE